MDTFVGKTIRFCLLEYLCVWTKTKRGWIGFQYQN